MAGFQSIYEQHSRAVYRFLLALTGDEDAAGYDAVSGTARVHPETGLNSVIPSPDGLHKYVVRRWEAARYQQEINALIR